MITLSSEIAELQRLVEQIIAQATLVTEITGKLALSMTRASLEQRIENLKGLQ